MSISQTNSYGGEDAGKHLNMFTRDFSNMFAHTYTDGGEPGLDVT